MENKSRVIDELVLVDTFTDKELVFVSNNINKCFKVKTGVGITGFTEKVLNKMPSLLSGHLRKHKEHYTNPYFILDIHATVGDEIVKRFKTKYSK